MHNSCNFIPDLKSLNLKHLKTLNYYLRVCKIKFTEGGNISDPRFTEITDETENGYFIIETLICQIPAYFIWPNKTRIICKVH